MSGSEISQSDNHLGVPTAEFWDDVEDFMKKDENHFDATLVIRRLDELHKKYRFIEMNLEMRKKRIRSQYLDLKVSLDMIKQLKLKQEEDKPFHTRFLLSDQVFTNAKVKPKTKTVCLWLGANVMLEYSLDEADELLQKNQSLAIEKLAQIDVDLEFLRTQITTTQVNMARVFNWDVHRRKDAQQQVSAPSAKTAAVTASS